MDAEYIVLRKPRGAIRRHKGADIQLAGSFRAGIFDEARAASRGPEHALSIERGRLSARDLSQVVRDDTVLAAVRAMPVTLIKPLAGKGGTKALGQAKAQQASWGITAIGADRSRATGAGVTVAVLDTGIDPKHPAFKGVKLEQQNFTASKNPNDEQGHGTHCAGTIFGRDVDGVRIGVAPGVTRALIGKVLDANGGGSSAGIVKGIEWAVNEGAMVVSMSLGFDFPRMVQVLQEEGLPAKLAASMALRAFRDNLRLFDALMAYVKARGELGTNCVIVAASGNDSRIRQDPRFRIEAGLPAAAAGVVSVGAVAAEGGRLVMADFSNVNPTLCAPGVQIVSAQLGGGLVAHNGTSMACPHVAGAAALWWEHFARIGNAEQVVAQLRATARTDVFAPGHDPRDHGAGMVNVP